MKESIERLRKALQQYANGKVPEGEQFSAWVSRTHYTQDVIEVLVSAMNVVEVSKKVLTDRYADPKFIRLYQGHRKVTANKSGFIGSHNLPYDADVD